MTRRDFDRDWTVIIIGGLSAATILCAVPVFRFGLIGATETGAVAARDFGALADNPIVGGLAREARIDEITLNAAARVTETERILARRPMSSIHWLELARALYAADAPPKEIFEALAMSQLTGPNEASVMAGRAVFGLSLWALASSDQHKALARDLVGGWSQVSETRRMLLRVMLQTALLQTRQELAGLLARYGQEGEAIRSRLGLEGVS